MKVAFSIGSINRGGAESLLLDILRQSKDAPFDMILIHRRGGAYRDDFYRTGIKCVQHIPQKLHLISYISQLRKLLLQEHIDVIHAHNVTDAIYAGIARLRTKCKLVLTFHGYMGCTCSFLQSCRYRIAIRLVDKVCFVSQYQKQRYIHRYPIEYKTEVIYNGIDWRKFDKTGIIDNCDLNEIEEHTIKLCMVGSFNSVRSQKVICQAMAIIKANHPNDYDKISFYFIGGQYNGEEYLYDECINICRGNNLSHIHFMGNRGDVPQLLQKMDGFVYSTENDTFGIAVVEAVASGLPTIVNDHPVMSEICEENEAIQYFSHHDALSCAQCIINLINHIDQYSVAAKKYALIIRQKYSISNHIHCLNELYTKI